MLLYNHDNSLSKFWIIDNSRGCSETRRISENFVGDPEILIIFGGVLSNLIR